MFYRTGLSKVGLRENFLVLLSLAEFKAGFEFEITSGFREGDKRSHGEGVAVDIACTESMKRLKLVKALTDVGFRRIGVYDKHIHVDRSWKLPQDVLWIGVSK